MTNIARLLSVALLIALAGCGANSEGPQTYPVTGTVTMGGQPVAGAMVAFTPDANQTGRVPGQASTDEDGEYDISIFLEQGKSTKRGLPAGEYRITVVKMEAAPGAASFDKPPKNVLPSKFASAESTPLKETVKADGENRFDIAL